MVVPVNQRHHNEARFSSVLFLGDSYAENGLGVLKMNPHSHLVGVGSPSSSVGSPPLRGRQWSNLSSDLRDPPLDRLGFGICHSTPLEPSADHWHSPLDAPIAGDAKAEGWWRLRFRVGCGMDEVAMGFGSANGVGDDVESKFCGWSAVGVEVTGGGWELRVVLNGARGPRSFEPECANPGDGDLLDSDQPTLSLLCPFNQGHRSFEPEGANLGDGELLDSDQPTLSLLCPFNQGLRSFEPEDANPGDGDFSIRTRWFQI
ncbi:hypothetical protein GQ457_14G021900 [Hibiscus cannabinus]